MQLVYGINPVLELLHTNSAIAKIVVATGRHDREIRKIVELAAKRKIAIEYAQRHAMDRIAPGNSQGVICYCPEYQYSDIDRILGNRRRPFGHDLVLILDSIQDPQNLGALIRSAFCFAANGVIIPADRAASLNPAAVKASAGTAFQLPVGRVTNLPNTIEHLKTRGFWIYGADPRGGARVEDLEITSSAALVVGSEGKGMRRLVREKCDFIVSVPIADRADSLNVSVAAGILLYQLMLKRVRNRSEQV